MRDDETGSFWQQISGKAISGPLAGQQLELVHSDEITFALWKQENPNGLILHPVAKFQKDYATKDWEVKMAKRHSIIDTQPTGRPPRELMLGLTLNGVSRAYPLDLVLKAKLVQDRLGGEPVILLGAVDGKSVRAFSPRLPSGAFPDFYRLDDPQAPRLLDSATGATWDFRGCATSGPIQGTCLKPLDAIKDYWFDWHLYHPDTSVWAPPTSP